MSGSSGTLPDVSPKLVKDDSSVWATLSDNSVRRKLSGIGERTRSALNVVSDTLGLPGRQEEGSARYIMEGDRKPWMNKNGDVVWRPIRIKLWNITTSQRFEAAMGAVIVFNLVIIIIEADYRAQCFPQWSDNISKCPYDPDAEPWLYWTNVLLLALYTVEALTHLYVQRLGYFYNRWNCLDFIVVCAGYFSMAVGGMVNISYLRIFRITRLTRAFRIVLSIRELYMLITGLVSSFKAIFFGTMLLGMMLVLWSIILVEFVHPVNAELFYDGCARCSRGFASVTDSTLTLFQTIIAGDSWGLIAVPVIEAQPLTALVLVAIVLSVSLGVMNLILAVIVESAAEAREADLEEKVKQKEKDQVSTKDQLMKLCAQMDYDNNGSISLEEMLQAWDASPTFRKAMMVLEVKRAELETIFHILDTNCDGEVDYAEFCDQLYDLRTNDVRMMVSMNKFTMQRFEIHMREHIATVLEHTTSNRAVLDLVFEMLKSMESQRKEDEVKAVTFETGDLERPSESTLNVEQKALRSDDVAADLVKLQSRLEELAWMSTDVSRKADEQSLTLQRHAGLLDAARKALPDLQKSAEKAPGSEKLDLVNQQFQKLQRHVRERMALLVQDLDRKIDEGSGALASGTRLLEALAAGLDLPAAPSVVETKANGSLPPSNWRSPRRHPLGSASAAGAAAAGGGRSGMPLPAGDRSGAICGCNGTEVPTRIVITK